MRVLVPMDGSEQSWTAFEHAADEFPEATLVCLRAIDPSKAGYGAGMEAGGVARVLDAERDAANDMLERAVERGDDRGVSVATAAEIGRPARVIIDATENEDIDHVVIGSHGRDGISRILLGSVAETVVRRSPVPVTVVR
ncbi:UspA domain protein [Natronomonas pharaonis DSM 2160]|uniref:UspA domain protein n=1 Tax=Natronomonas pharaonis (strain ATCC 35678 / DSM 2160 / CIP 103997 / JCM 8858 / NBRC 14720 / NCIMB 2260 / Gabara) TaxID=348780 RepID=A0A1U7EZ88_NATPD|nr:universal stress protein [Natronomonas pharaonis]CAI50603.1 UspA domain protein [Natronomonas pharaonis DSM 2160]